MAQDHSILSNCCEISSLSTLHNTNATGNPLQLLDFYASSSSV